MIVANGDNQNSYAIPVLGYAKQSQSVIPRTECTHSRRDRHRRDERRPRVRPLGGRMTADQDFRRQLRDAPGNYLQLIM